jgi:hypothetical protein
MKNDPLPTKSSVVAIDVAFGVKRTCPFALHTSAFDPKRTLLSSERHNICTRLGLLPQKNGEQIAA